MKEAAGAPDAAGLPPRAARLSEVARRLQQLVELGGDALFLERTTREDVFAAVRRARAVERERGRGEGKPAAGPAPGGGRRRDAAVPARGGKRRLSDPSPSGGASGGPSLEGIGGWDYETVRNASLGCRRCGLSERRTQVVFSDGNPRGRVMVVGEGPGAREDATGLPFVGPAGNLLDLLLASVGLSRRDSVYICNVVKCRPPGNRNPLPEEIERCTPYLRRQIQLVGPRVILAAGAFAAHYLTGERLALGRLRERTHRFEDIPVVVTYHPAALLRNPAWTRPVWRDLQRLRGILAGDDGGGRQA